MEESEDYKWHRNLAVARWFSIRFGAIAAAHRGFTNGLACMARLLAWRYVSRRIAPPLWRSRRGTVILTPHYTWFGAIECFGSDQYRLHGLPQGYPIHCFLDIGANVGAFTLAVLERWPDARGIACEPSLESCEALNANLRRNHHQSCEILPMAVVGNGLSSASFYYKPTSPMVSSIISGVGPPHREQVIRVPATSLGDLIERVPKPIDLVKIDIEGGEYQVMENTRLELLSRIKLLVMEYHRVPGHSHEELVVRLAQAGLPLCRHEPPLMWFGSWHQH